MDEKIKHSIRHVRRWSKLDPLEVYKSKMKDVEKYFKDLRNTLKELYYYIVIFLFMEKAKPYIIAQRSGGEEKVVFFKRNWIVDDEYSIQEYFCDISKQLDKDLTKTDRYTLLKVLEVDFKGFIGNGSKEFTNFLDRIREGNVREAGKILMGYICESLRKSEKLEEDRGSIQSLIERYLKVIYKVDCVETSYTEVAKKIFEQLFDQKRILELEVFRYISNLGYPCIPNVMIKTEDEKPLEFDILVLTNRGMKLVEVTKYGRIEERVKDRKKDRENLTISQRLPIIFVCNIEKPKEEPDEGLYYVPFKELDKIGEYLERG
ncbi:hypothetical protein KEJ27_09255 [Candidatus Bathyarchaeota archaeon]|nr:hypothetical protein [Candidatus Bathyarchaeota archaeon]